jgi:hypothetical protein
MFADIRCVLPTLRAAFRVMKLMNLSSFTGKIRSRYVTENRDVDAIWFSRKIAIFDSINQTIPSFPRRHSHCSLFIVVVTDAA